MPAMRAAHEKLNGHLDRFFTELNISREGVEAEGLGLRPLTAAESLSKSDRSILARRYYRLAQWSETLQSGFWLTVNFCILDESGAALS